MKYRIVSRPMQIDPKCLGYYVQQFEDGRWAHVTVYPTELGAREHVEQLLKPAQPEIVIAEFES